MFTLRIILYNKYFCFASVFFPKKTVLLERVFLLDTFLFNNACFPDVDQKNTLSIKRNCRTKTTEPFFSPNFDTEETSMSLTPSTSLGRRKRRAKQTEKCTIQTIKNIEIPYTNSLLWNLLGTGVGAAKK